ncbi:hypothetical protein [Cryobacterium fucosi]|uniref:DUF4352 domain-containing protein n=1 Tax=Cryobacterium fucosi TaxID=1259157 RepID=A0A4R9B2U7_9MICO|nr:hypothetical protein [Cryobacterium fucosi]TFD74748.1 hypothetical protein E3T48_12545 [Cryobacterium fucosi]
MKKASIIILAAVLTLTGCVPVSQVRERPTDPGPSFAATPETEKPSPPTTAKFGEAVTYLNDLSISVSVPAPYTPGEYAAGHDRPAAVVFNITVTNGGTKNFEPFLYSTASSGGAEASKIYDGDIGSSPNTVILPGQTITYSEAYSVNDPAQIVFQIKPSFEYDDAIFTQ